VNIQLRDSPTIFAPANTTVPRGTTVTWHWSGALLHDLNSNDFPSDPAGIKMAGTYTFTFSIPGTYSYFCSVHLQPAPAMRGTITVTD
jgi:plastocyanin